MAGIVTIETADGTTVVTLQGDIDTAVADGLRRALVAAILRGRPRHLVIDLGSVGSIEPGNAGALAAACQTAGDLSIPCTVSRARPEVALLLEDAGLPPYVDVSHPPFT